MKVYTIDTTGQQVESYFLAIEIAENLKSTVSFGDMVKWEPAKPVSAKKQRIYNERLSARKAYESLLNK